MKISRPMANIIGIGGRQSWNKINSTILWHLSLMLQQLFSLNSLPCKQFVLLSNYGARKIVCWIFMFQVGNVCLLYPPYYVNHFLLYSIYQQFVKTFVNTLRMKLSNEEKWSNSINFFLYIFMRKRERKMKTKKL